MRASLGFMFMLMMVLSGCQGVGEPQRSLSGFGPIDPSLTERLKPSLEGDWWLVLVDGDEPRRVAISGGNGKEWTILYEAKDGWTGYGVGIIERDGTLYFDLRDLKQERFSRFSVPTYVFGTLDFSEHSLIARVVADHSPSDAADYKIDGLVFHEFAAGINERTSLRAFDPSDEREVLKFDELDSQVITSGSNEAIREFVIAACRNEQFLMLPIILTREPFQLQEGWSPDQIRSALRAHDDWLGERINSMRTGQGDLE